ncbi:MAG: helix-turn-helix domain-containing protein [Armatimonadota bacterium]|jgi:DNA-binding transcriptional regulator YiaG
MIDTVNDREGEAEEGRSRGAQEMGDRIGQARREAGFRTAQDFSEALDVSVWTVRSWESGKSQPRYDMLGTISQLTGRPKAWFLGEGAVHDRLDRAMGELLARRETRDGDEDAEPGVYGIPARNRAAEEELQALSSDARDWGVLIRVTNAVPPVAADEIAALHLALANLMAQKKE